MADRRSEGIFAFAQRIEAGDLSVATLVASRIERAQDLSHLNAFIAIDTVGALAAAARLDHARPRSPLAGMPLAHKDIFGRHGRQPTCGVPGGADHGLPPSPLLDRLTVAGTVDLGPLNLAEFALGVTGTNAFHGDVGNPWDLTRCAGASSSGSAAAVAAGLVLGSLGTDSGASVRLPASFCGVVGLKPTGGTLPLDGVFPLAWSVDEPGVLAGSIEDCAVLFAAAGGATSRRCTTQRPVIGVPRSYYVEDLQPDVASAFARAIGVFEAAGFTVRDVDVVETPQMRSLHRAIMRTEAAAVHRMALRRNPSHYSASVRMFVNSGEGIFAVDYADALRLRAALVASSLATTFAAVDVLLTPTCFCVAPAYEDMAQTDRPEVRAAIGRLAHFTQPASYLGLPALSVPFALSGDGLPVGLQLVGRPREEHVLFAAASPLEAHWRALGLSPGCVL